MLQRCADYVTEQVHVRHTDVRIRGAWNIRYALGLYDVSFTVPREFALIQTSGFGSCHFEGDHTAADLGELIGLSALQLHQYPIPYQIAGYDAAASSFREPYSAKIVLTGENQEKVTKRSQVIYEVTKATCNSILRRKRIVRFTMIGILGNVLSLFVKDHDFEVSAIDRNSRVVGKNYHGVVVQDQSHMADAIGSSDMVLLSGMSLGIDGLDWIFDTARQSGAALVLYMQTGAHLARPVLSSGAHAVISEEYPFYFMGPGRSVIKVRTR